MTHGRPSTLVLDGQRPVTGVGGLPELGHQQGDPGRGPAAAPALDGQLPVAGVDGLPELGHQQGDPGRGPAVAPALDGQLPVAGVGGLPEPAYQQGDHGILSDGRISTCKTRGPIKGPIYEQHR